MLLRAFIQQYVKHFIKVHCTRAHLYQYRPYLEMTLGRIFTDLLLQTRDPDVVYALYKPIDSVCVTKLRWLLDSLILNLVIAIPPNPKMIAELKLIGKHRGTFFLPGYTAQPLTYYSRKIYHLLDEKSHCLFVITPETKQFSVVLDALTLYEPAVLAVRMSREVVINPVALGPLMVHRLTAEVRIH